MFYVRTPRDLGEDVIGSALSLLWMVVHSVQGIGLKDLKQILRKEQVIHTKNVHVQVSKFKLMFAETIFKYENYYEYITNFL